jgi:RND family efflux transporter MFP subunit
MLQKFVASPSSARRFVWFLLPALLAWPARADDPKAGQVVYECSGYVVPVRQVLVSSRISSQVIELDAEEGKAVQKGHVLARLDPTEYKMKLEIAAAGLEIARARLVKIKAKGNEHDFAIAGAEVARAKAEVEQAQWQLDGTTIRAPLSGTILMKRTEAGNRVNHRAFGGSSGICEIADLRELEVAVDIVERDISRFAKGQPCLIQLDAYPRTTYQGQVSRIMPVADRAKGTIPLRVKIVVPAKDTRLRPEMRAVVKFLKDSV